MPVVENGNYVGATVAVQAIYSNRKVHTSPTQISLSIRFHDVARTVRCHTIRIPCPMQDFSLLEDQTGPIESRRRVDAWFPALHSPMPWSLST